MIVTVIHEIILAQRNVNEIVMTVNSKQFIFFLTESNGLSFSKSVMFIQYMISSNEYTAVMISKVYKNTHSIELNMMITVTESIVKKKSAILHEMAHK